MLKNVTIRDQLRGVSSRKAKPDEFKSVRDPLVDEEIAKGWSRGKKNKTTTRLSKPKSHDKALEDRVWTFMYRIGFKFLSGHGGAYQLLNEDEKETPQNQIDLISIHNIIPFFN